MKTALLKLGGQRRQLFHVEPTLRRLSSDQNSRYKTGSTPRLKFLCIALAMSALAVIPIGAKVASDLSDSSDNSESRYDKSSSTNQFLTAYNSMLEADLM